jgi:hypothetical protein
VRDLGEVVRILREVVGILAEVGRYLRKGFA